MNLGGSEKNPPHRKERGFVKREIHVDFMVGVPVTEGMVTVL